MWVCGWFSFGWLLCVCFGLFGLWFGGGFCLFFWGLIWCYLCGVADWILFGVSWGLLFVRFFRFWIGGLCYCVAVGCVGFQVVVWGLGIFWH